MTRDLVDLFYYFNRFNSLKYSGEGYVHLVIQSKWVLLIFNFFHLKWFQIIKKKKNFLVKCLYSRFGNHPFKRTTVLLRGIFRALYVNSDDDDDDDKTLFTPQNGRQKSVRSKSPLLRGPRGRSWPQQRDASAKRIKRN